MIYQKDLNRILDELKKRKQLLENELTQLPEGQFYSYSKNGVTNYVQRIPASGNAKKEKRYGVKRDKDKLYRLVRKKYVTEALGLIKKDIRAMETLLRWYKPSDENSVMKDFVEKHPDLTEGIYYGLMSHERWAKSFNAGKDFYTESLKSTAADGSKRRSLGELLIGAKLDQYGIPYRFEAPIDHPDIPYIPDFTIKRPRDGKIIYWEHLGRVNDEDYLNNNKHKFDVYERYGIVPWDNLIISYSQKDYGINEKLIDGLIQGWLL